MSSDADVDDHAGLISHHSTGHGLATPESRFDVGGEVKDYHINVFWSDEDGGYIADIPDLSGCSAFASSSGQAVAEVNQTKEAWLAAARRVGAVHP